MWGRGVELHEAYQLLVGKLQQRQKGGEQAGCGGSLGKSGECGGSEAKSGECGGSQAQGEEAGVRGDMGESVESAVVP